MHGSDGLDEITLTGPTFVASASLDEAGPMHLAFTRSTAASTKLDLTVYPGATHDFDDPGEERQKVPGNRAAKADAMVRAIGIVPGMAP